MRLGGSTEGGVAAVVTTGEFAIADAAAAAAAAAMAVVDVELDRLNDIAVVQLTEPSSSGANVVSPDLKSKDQESTYLETRPLSLKSQLESLLLYLFLTFFWRCWLLCFRLVRLVASRSRFTGGSAARPRCCYFSR